MALFFGNAIGIGLVFFALLLPAYKWGAESFTFMRSAFGPLGCSLLAVLFVAGNVPFWIAILSSMAGSSASEMLVGLGLLAGSERLVEKSITFAVLAASAILAARGSNSLRLLNLYLVPLLAGLSVVLLVAVFVQAGWSAIIAAQPVVPPYDRGTNLMLAVELNIVGALGWFGLTANLARLGKSVRGAVWGSWIGLVPVYIVSAGSGLAASLTLGSADPVQWMTPLLGTTLGLAMLVILVLANLSSIVGMLQGNMATIIQTFGRPVQALGFARTVFAVAFLAGLIVLLATDAFYTRFYSVIAFLGAVFAGCVGVLLADRLVLRRNRLCIRGLHDTRPCGPYYFWRGVNPAAFAALAAGFVSYLALLEPLNQTPGAGFRYLSASLPATAVAFMSHLLLSRIITIPFGFGDYPRSRPLRKGVAVRRRSVRVPGLQGEFAADVCRGAFAADPGRDVAFGDRIGCHGEDAATADERRLSIGAQTGTGIGVQ